MDSKVCTHCGGGPQPLENFPLRRGSPDGRDRSCKECHRRWWRRRQDATAEQRKREIAQRRLDRERRREAETVERFWVKVDRGNADDCWEWTASLNHAGYGQFIERHGHTIGAHRFAYELQCGPIPAGMCLLHRCDNRRCVNPAHLWIGTRPENSIDMRVKGRSPRGERSGTHKLTEAEVLTIIRRASAGETRRALADEYGISQSTVSDYINGKLWSHIR